MNNKWRLRFGMVGVFLTISAYSKDSRSLHMKSMAESPLSILNQYLTNLSISFYNFQHLSFLNYKLLNLVLFGVILVANLIKWTIFGKLTHNEVNNLKDKVSYTIWEFWFGFFIFLKEIRSKDYSDGDNNKGLNLIIETEFWKYSGLFLCVMLLKSFHFLSNDRLYSLSINFDHKNSSIMNQFKKLGFGILILNCIDVLLMFSFIYQVFYIYNQSKILNFKDNILISIFGFEIFNIYPLICFTGSKFITMYYNIDNPKVNFTKTLNVIEIFTNLIRFLMTGTFAILFLYFYTFPIHILPSSYLSLRILIIKIRCLISLEKKTMKLNKDLLIDSDSTCVICIDYLNNSNSDGIRCLDSCDHTFHYTCLKNWLKYSDSCPVCRITISNNRENVDVH